MHGAAWNLLRHVSRPSCVKLVIPLMCAVLLIGCGEARQQAGSEPGRQSMVAATVSGGSAAQRALVRHILHGMSSGLITNVRIGRPAPGDHVQDPGHTAGWLWITAPASASPRSRDSHGSGIVPEWAANLLQAAYVHRARQARVPALLGYSLTLRLPGGRLVPDDGNTPQGDGAVTGTVSDARVRAAFAAAAAHAHLNVARITLLHPDHTAVSATYVASSPTDFGRRLPLLLALPEVFGHIDGYLIVVRDSCGRTVASAAAGGNESSSWVDPAWACPNPLAFSDIGSPQCPPRVRAPISC